MEKAPFIYIVGKEDQGRNTLEKRFTESGYKVFCYSDAQRFLNHISLAASPIRPELVIVDVMADGLSGFETIRRLAERYQDKYVPMIMTSSYASPEDKLEAQNAGAICCLMKPVQFDDINRVVEGEKVRRQRLSQSARIAIK